MAIDAGHGQQVTASDDTSELDGLDEGATPFRCDHLSILNPILAIVAMDDTPLIDNVSMS